MNNLSHFISLHYKPVLVTTTSFLVIRTRYNDNGALELASFASILNASKRTASLFSRFKSRSSFALLAFLMLLLALHSEVNDVLVSFADTKQVVWSEANGAR